MQLKRKSGRVAPILGLLTANLLAQAPAMAQESAPAAEGILAPAKPAAASRNAYDDSASELGTTVVDSAVLFYQESGGRVRAIEPVIGVTRNANNGDIFSAKLTFDTLTGATPNGAAPWSVVQTFVTPANHYGSSASKESDERRGATRTGASGTIVTDPITGAQVRQYTAAANTLPVDSGYKDNRVAADLGYSTLLRPTTRLNVGANASVESDYQSFSGRVGIAQDLNNKNTTLSLGANFEHDRSKPYYGTPTPFAVMSGLQKGGPRSKDVLSVVAGVTQVMSRNWLVQLNYSYGSSKGYQTDPYKILSVVDASSGAPLRYVYEGRPDNRTRQSVYFGTKLATGSLVTDASARYYHDSWGINAITFELSERVPIGASAYVEPLGRYYHQSAADFFHPYLLATQALPKYASADSRLDRFNAVTFGVKGGYKLSDRFELYGLVENYRQSGTDHPAGAPGGLARQNLFAGTDSISVVAGLKVTFR